MPAKEQGPPLIVVEPTPKSTPPSKSSIKSPTTRASITKKESATNKQSNSGIPLRLKTGSNTATKPTGKTGTYRHPSQPVGPVINKNTLEVQFLNNKKRLLKLHADLVEKQRPLLDMHKSLMRTKKQLEELGKKVVLEEIKIVSLKTDDVKNQMDGAGENPAAEETAMNLKSSIENVLDTCVKACKKCFVKRDQVVKMLESASKSTIEPEELEAEVEVFKKERDELEQTIEGAIKENEKKIEQLINNWQKAVKMGGMTEQLTNKIAELEETVKQQQKTIQDAEDNLHSLSRKYEDKKNTYEKTIAEMQEKYNVSLFIQIFIKGQNITEMLTL